MAINPNDVVWDGTPYKWGGKSKSGFDCSGWVCDQLKANGIDVQDTASGLAKRAADAGGLSDDLSTIGPGSLIFLSNPANPKHAKSRFKNIYHTGIVVEQDGNLYVSDAQSKRGVGLTPLADYFKRTASKILTAPMSIFSSQAHAADLINPKDVKWDDVGIDESKIAWDDEKPSMLFSVAKNVISPESIEFDTYVEPSQRAGQVIKEGIEKTQEAIFYTLNKALEKTHKAVIDPVRQRDITSQSGGDIPSPGMGAPEAFAPLPEEKTFVSTMEFALAPSYFKLLGRAGQLLKKFGKDSFYKFAPDWMFRQGEGGLPEVLSSESIAQRLSAMSGPERAAMARKYHQFRDVLNEMTNGVRAAEEATPVTATGVRAIGRPSIAGELVVPQLKLPPAQGFTFHGPTIRRPAPPTEYPGDYLAVQEVPTPPVERFVGGKRVEGTPLKIKELQEKNDIYKKAVEEGNLAYLVKLHGGIDPNTYLVQRDLAPEEKKKLAFYFRKGGLYPDKMLQELQISYPGLTAGIEDDSDFLHKLANGELGKIDLKKGEKEHYDKLKAEEEENKRLARMARLQENLEREAIQAVENGEIKFDPNVDYFGVDLLDMPKVSTAVPGEAISSASGISPQIEDAIKKFYSGVPGPDTVTIIKKLKQWDKKLFTNLSKKDMGMIAEYTDLPFWRAQQSPKAKQVYKVQESRETARAVANDTILEELVNHIKYLKNLQTNDPGEWKRLNQAAFHFDRIRHEPTDEDLVKFRLSEQSIAAYRKARELLDFTRDDFFYLMEELGAPADEIAKLRREVGKIPGYIPHSRTGKYYVKVESPDGGTAYREHFDDVLATLTMGRSVKAKKKIADLEKKYPGAMVSAGKVEQLPEEYFWHVDTANMQAIIDSAVSGLNLGEGEEPLRKALYEAGAKTFMKRGYGRHFIKRQDIPGYDQTDFMAATIANLRGYYGFKTKMKAAYDFQKALKAFGPQERERLYWDKYVRDMLANATQWDKTVDKLRGGAFLYFLGGVPRQILLQPTQNYIAGVPNLQQYSKWSTFKITSEMAKAASDIILGRKGKRFSEDERAGLDMARKKGIIDWQLTREYEGYLDGMFGKAGKGLSKVAGFFIGNAEIFNRETMYITAYRIAKSELNKNHLGAMEFAEDMVQRTHFRYGKGNLPPFARGGGAAKLARTAYTFRSYNHNLIRLYWDLGMIRGGQKGAEAILKSLAALMAFGGIAAIPFKKDIERWYQKRTGKNISTEINKTAGEWGKYINYGLPAMVGIDLSGSLGIESAKEWKDIPGIPYALGVEMPSRVLEDIKRKDYYRAVENAAPSLIKSPLAAYRMATEGMTTRSGKKILDADGKPIKLTTGEAITKGLTFNPVKLAENRRQYEAQTLAKETWDKRKDEVLASYRKMVNRYGSESVEVKEIIGDIKKFNDDLRRNKITYIAPITVKTLQSNQKESKRTKALKQKFK